MDVSVCISPVLHQNVHHPLVMGEWMGSLREVSEITHNVLHIEFPFLPTKNSTNYLPAVCACIFICTMRSDSKMFLALCLLSCQPPHPPPCLSSELLFSFLCYKFPLGQIVTGEERSPDTRGGEEGGGGEKMERMSNDRKRINECRKGKIDNEDEEKRIEEKRTKGKERRKEGSGVFF